jgi:hypothetical protein
MLKKRLVGCLAALPLVLIAGYAAAEPGGQSSLAAAREATARFHDLQTAIDAGYNVELPDVNGKTCIANLTNPSAGAMGVHMVDVSKVGDPKLDPTDPEALVYERRNDGTLKLVALEYVVFQSAVSSRPSLFGVPFDANDGSRFGLPPFWALHAWIWKPNPSEPAGIFNAWNPRVSCPT